MNRRKFIRNNLMAIPAISILNEASAKEAVTADSKIKFFCPRWGAADPWDSFCKRVKEAGYDGIETPLSSIDAPEKEEIMIALKKYGLTVIGQYYQSLEADVESNARNLKLHLKSLATLKPLFINAQTGKDFFTIEQNKKVFATAFQFTKESGVEVVHETHRGKALFAAPITKQYIEQLPDLRLTLDISHWCNVHESLLHDQTDAVDLALSRTHHIHSRIGYQEGPQVNDPRAPEWKDTVDTHLKWWDKVVDLHRKANRILTVTTEFGPPTYMPVLPYTKMPVADQWEINVYMMKLLKARYQVA
jgi:sugar phosphate isomerase/epimerase